MARSDNPPAERTALRLVPILTLVGIAGLLVTLLLGFEEPHTLLLVVSSFLVVSAPVAIFDHVLFTRHLDSNEKRELIGYFLSRHAAVAIDEYVSSTDRRAGLARLRQITRRQAE